MTWLRDHNRTVPVADRLATVALLLKATARAAAEVGALNGHWQSGRFHPSTTVDLGVATSLRGGGLLVPVLADATTLTVIELMLRQHELAVVALGQRARPGVEQLHRLHPGRGPLISSPPRSSSRTSATWAWTWYTA